MRYSQIALSVALACGMTLTAVAEEHRQHGAHEHGGGQLDVAVEKNSLMIDLSLPAMNIVGFEHPANNDKEHEQVEQAADLLKDGMRLFAPSPGAKCKLLHAEVESALLLGEEDHHHDEEDHEEEGHDNGHDHEHADFDVAYEFICTEPSQLTALTSSLFERFPGTKHLRTQVITPSHQGGGELSVDHNVLQLK